MTSEPFVLSLVVEGHGEVAALPQVLLRLAAQFVTEPWPVLQRPSRVSRDRLIKPGGLEGELARARAASAILVLIDSDDDCPASLGPALLQRAEQAVPDKRIAVVLAHREFEAWFMAAAPSLAGRRGLSEGLEIPHNVETRRDCKGWLTEHRVDGLKYNPRADQAALAAVFDLDMARTNAPSFDKFCRDVAYLLTGKRVSG